MDPTLGSGQEEQGPRMIHQVRTGRGQQAGRKAGGMKKEEEEGLPSFSRSLLCGEKRLCKRETVSQECFVFYCFVSLCFKTGGTLSLSTHISEIPQAKVFYTCISCSLHFRS